MSTNNTSGVNGVGCSVDDGFKTVVVTKNPIPEGTTFTIMMPWVEASTTCEFVAKILNRLEWGRILDINMIYKRAEGKKRHHYKVFVHYGARNPAHRPVFEYLEKENNEMKMWYNERFFWKVRRSTWKADKRNNIRLDFGTTSTPAPPATRPARQPTWTTEHCRRSI